MIRRAAADQQVLVDYPTFWSSYVWHSLHSLHFGFAQQHSVSWRTGFQGCHNHFWLPFLRWLNCYASPGLFQEKTPVRLRNLFIFDFLSMRIVLEINSHHEAFRTQLNQLYAVGLPQAKIRKTGGVLQKTRSAKPRTL